MLKDFEQPFHNRLTHPISKWLSLHRPYPSVPKRIVIRSSLIYLILHELYYGIVFHLAAGISIRHVYPLTPS
jgi:hypothetical protein